MFKGYFISVIYFITALIFVVLAWSEQSESLTIVFNETYIVLPKSIVWLVLAGLFIFFAGISLCFELFRQRMNKYLFGTHYLLTIISLLIIYFAIQQEQKGMPSITSDYSVLEDMQNQSEETTDWIIYAFYMLVGAQIIFVLNILISSIRNRRLTTRDS
ncbi:hypothetical protein [Fluviicola taffensis]|uniref:Uncharacterized protein n=1 Tax=Fluviicola taffensis (strain DSM 16823 / NCIMB 13979 / RW262) TaxID=755732 RepID=F2IEM1_FLUTR|nr:hypothetical protein [Fluviicola taffensis]AEA44560.1 hypothetical protein Fluta_2576 [Fluviicola taffensis DSM 16823]